MGPGRGSGVCGISFGDWCRGHLFVLRGARARPRSLEQSAPFPRCFPFASPGVSKTAFCAHRLLVIAALPQVDGAAVERELLGPWHGEGGHPANIRPVPGPARALLEGVPECVLLGQVLGMDAGTMPVFACVLLEGVMGYILLGQVLAMFAGVMESLRALPRVACVCACAFARAWDCCNAQQLVASCETTGRTSDERAAGSRQHPLAFSAYGFPSYVQSRADYGGHGHLSQCLVSMEMISETY